MNSTHIPHHNVQGAMEEFIISYFHRHHRLPALTRHALMCHFGRAECQLAYQKC